MAIKGILIKSGSDSPHQRELSFQMLAETCAK